MSEITDKMDLGVDADNMIKKTNISRMENMKDAQKLGKRGSNPGVGLELTTKMIRNPL